LLARLGLKPKVVPGSGGGDPLPPTPGAPPIAAAPPVPLGVVDWSQAEAEANSTARVDDVSQQEMVRIIIGIVLHGRSRRSRDNPAQCSASKALHKPTSAACPSRKRHPSRCGAMISDRRPRQTGESGDPRTTRGHSGDRLCPAGRTAPAAWAANTGKPTQPVACTGDADRPRPEVRSPQPISAGSTLLGSGESLPSERCVRHGW